MLWMLLAASAPVYLTCMLNENGTPLGVNVMVDEADQRATIDLETGYAVTRDAVISQTTVRIPDAESTWTIDRSSLALSRRVTVGEKQWMDSGKCEVKPAPAKRAF